MHPDYAIAQFRFLNRLLLVHGRYNYQKNASQVILYSFYKTSHWFRIVSLCFINGQSGTTLFESFVVMAGWSCLALPIIAIGIFDRDVSEAHSSNESETVCHWTEECAFEQLNS
jgi:magnesium-transporting ATPase (P-type)